MRSLVILCVMGATAAAEPLPVDVVTKGSAGDWTIFDGVRLENGKLVDERTLVMLSAAKIDSAYGTRVVIGTMRVEWYRGHPRQPLAWWREDKVSGVIEPKLFGFTTTVKNFKTAPATCRLDKSFPCTKVTFSGQSLEDASKELTIVATMADRIIGSGLVEIEVQDNGVMLRRYKVVGYGHASSGRWGLAADGIQVEPRPKTPPTVPSGPQVGPTGMVTEIPDADAPPPSVSIGQPASTGDLDKAIIRRYVKRNIQKLAYCYDKELLAKPKLKGTITATFEIGGDGKVTSATAKGFDVTVAECVATVIKAIEFPKPKNEGKVNVTYPLVYEPPPKKR